MNQRIYRVRGVERTRRRWPRVVALLFLTLVCSAFFAPDIVLRTPLRDILLQKLVPKHAAQLDVQSITAGWRTPLLARGIRYRDPALEIEIESARTNRSLLDLLLNPRDYGLVELESPRVVLLNTSGPGQSPPARSTATAQQVDPTHPPTGTTGTAPAARNSAYRPIGHCIARGGQIAALGPNQSLLPIAHHVDMDMELPADGRNATFRVLARTGDPATTAHISAAGTIDWPFQSLTRSLHETHIDLVAIDSAMIDPLLATAGIPISLAPAGNRDAPVRVHGYITGNATLRSNKNHSVQLEVNLEVRSVEVAVAERSLSFEEPLVTVSAVGRMGSGSLELGALEIVADAFTIEAGGRLSDRSGSIVADLAGTTLCDWQKLGDRAGPLVRDNVSLSGRSRRPWRLSGPLNSSSLPQLAQQLEIDVATAFDALRLFDLDAGPLELAAHWRNGTAVFDALTADFQNGQIACKPAVDFTAQPPVLSVAPGRVLENVTLDPQLCAWILRYVDPLATVSGNLQGKLSLDLDELRVPLEPSGLEHGVIQGRILLDDVEFSPGPSLAGILAGAGIEIPKNLRTSQSIAIRLEDGRVYHAGLALPLNEQQVTLDGWVALDHSMRIRVSLPVTEKMLGRDKRLVRLLRSQRIDVEIAGTLEKPRVSDDALSRNIQRLIQATLRENLLSEDALRGLLRRAIK